MEKILAALGQNFQIMGKNDLHPAIFRELAAELIGTFFLIYIGCGGKSVAYYSLFDTNILPWSKSMQCVFILNEKYQYHQSYNDILIANVLVFQISRFQKHSRHFWPITWPTINIFQRD